MFEVFKTNVTEKYQVEELIHQIKMDFTDYDVNFDLEDCDRILRVKTTGGPVQSSNMINLLKIRGFEAEVLPDEIPNIRFNQEKCDIDLNYN